MCKGNKAWLRLTHAHLYRYFNNNSKHLGFTCARQCAKNFTRSASFCFHNSMEFFLDPLIERKMRLGKVK